MENEITIAILTIMALIAGASWVLRLCIRDFKKTMNEFDRIEKGEVSELSSSARYRQTAEKMEELK